MKHHRNPPSTLKLLCRVWSRKRFQQFQIPRSHQDPRCHRHRDTSHVRPWKSSIHDSLPWGLHTCNTRWPTNRLHRRCISSIWAHNHPSWTKRRRRSRKHSLSHTFRSLIKVQMLSHRQPKLRQFNTKQRNWKNHDHSTKLIISWTCNRRSTRRVMWLTTKDQNSSRRAAIKFKLAMELPCVNFSARYQKDDVWKVKNVRALCEVAKFSRLLSALDDNWSGYLAFLFRLKL